MSRQLELARLPGVHGEAVNMLDAVERHRLAAVRLSGQRNGKDEENRQEGTYNALEAPAAAVKSRLWKRRKIEPGYLRISSR